MEKIHTMLDIALPEIFTTIVVLCVIAVVGYVAFKIIKGCFTKGFMVAFIAIIVAAVVWYQFLR